MPEQLTLDTNLARDALEPHRAGHAAMLKLLELADQGDVDLVVTQRIEQDIPSDPLAARLRELPELGIGSTFAPMRLDVDRIGMAVLGDQGFVDACAAILASGWKPSKGDPPDWRDQDHVHTHHLNQRDVFLTHDRTLREFCDELSARGSSVQGNDVGGLPRLKIEFAMTAASDWEMWVAIGTLALAARRQRSTDLAHVGGRDRHRADLLSPRRRPCKRQRAARIGTGGRHLRRTR